MQKKVLRYTHNVPITESTLKSLAETGAARVVTHEGATCDLVVEIATLDEISHVVETKGDDGFVIKLGRDIFDRLLAGRRTSIVWSSPERIVSENPIVIVEEVHDIAFVRQREGFVEEVSA